MGSGQSKSSSYGRTYSQSNDSLLYKYNPPQGNKGIFGKCANRFKPMDSGGKAAHGTSTQSDGAPTSADEKSFRIGTIFKRSYDRRNYNSLKEPISRKYPWRGGLGNYQKEDQNISLLPKQHSLRPWGPIRNFGTSGASYSTPLTSDNDKKVTHRCKSKTSEFNIRDAQSRFCKEIKERYAAMDAREKQKRLDAIEALERRIQLKSGFPILNSASVNSQEPKKDNEGKTATQVRDIQAWRVEHFINNNDKIKAIGSDYDKKSQMKINLDSQHGHVPSNSLDNERPQRSTRSCTKENNIAPQKLEDIKAKNDNTVRESSYRSQSKKISNMVYVNKMYNYSRLHSHMATNGNFSKFRGPSMKNVIYPRQNNKAVFLLLKTFSEKPYSSVTKLNSKTGADVACYSDKSTSISREAISLGLKSVETQTLPVHISRKITLLPGCSSQMGIAPKLEVDHRGSLTRYMTSGPSNRSNRQSVIVGYCQGVAIDARKERSEHPAVGSGRKDKIAHSKAMAFEKESTKSASQHHPKEHNHYDRRTCRNYTRSDGNQSHNRSFKEHWASENSDSEYFESFSSSGNKYQTCNRGQCSEENISDEKARSIELKQGQRIPGKSYNNSPPKSNSERDNKIRSSRFGEKPFESTGGYTSHPKTCPHKSEKVKLPRRFMGDEDDNSLDLESKKLCLNRYMTPFSIPLQECDGAGDGGKPQSRTVMTAKVQVERGSSEEPDSDDCTGAERKTCHHWGQNSGSRCEICLERVCYNIKEDDENSETS